jgi:hydroxysqualene dehydroxylase
MAGCGATRSDGARPPVSTDTRVAILGGGYAGMAAAVTLSDEGVPVTVFEAAGHLGGRARRIEYRGETLDNGLHMLIGAYRETLRLVRLVHPDLDTVLLRLPLDWRIANAFRLRAAPLPAPLNLAAGLITASGVSLMARLAALRFVRALKTASFRLPGDTTVAELLESHRQDDAVSRHLWRPLCVAALNTPPEQASAQVFANVLRDSFGRARADSDLLLARCDLSALFPDGAADYVRARGGEVTLGCTVTAVTGERGRFAIHAHGEQHEFTDVICALSPHRLGAVIEELPQLAGIAATVAQFRYQPIYSVYLQYAKRPPLPAQLVGLEGGLVHWVFDREAICGEPGRLAAVISAEGRHQEMEQDALAQCVHAELAQNFGPLPEPLWRRVIAEKRATFSCTPGLERPGQRTPLAGFHLAGDYVASEYPATLEAAVRSGINCARQVLESMRNGPKPSLSTV